MKYTSYIFNAVKEKLLLEYVLASLLVFMMYVKKFYFLLAGHNDWWTLMESEPSLGSTTQLHLPTTRGPELFTGPNDIELPYVKVNRGK